MNQKVESIITSVSEPVWANAEKTAIDCFITIDAFGEEKLPFTATPNDPEAHGVKIFNDIVSSLYGDIGDYVPAQKPSDSNVIDADIPKAIL